jgi:hypothetical protein
MSLAPEKVERPSYFLVSVSTRENLELCIRYGLAGFPGGESGAWTFCEIETGDFVSFLYGAKAYNLYRVSEREAVTEAERLPPWKPLTFRETGRTYYFPFRLHLRPVRTFVESLVRAEFSYVAENLLLRGGYRRTHFQADQTTLQSVSQMGRRADHMVDELICPPHATFTLQFSRNSELIRAPERCRFREPILQSAIRRHLMSSDNLQRFAARVHFEFDRIDHLEVLGEKALPQGHIDLLLKERTPLGSALRVPIEVKLNRAGPADLVQLRRYMDELAEDCPFGILIAADFGRLASRRATDMGIRLVRYELSSDLKNAPTFQEIFGGLTLEPLGT